MDFPKYILEAKMAFKISESTTDFRIDVPAMNNIESWKNYPNQEYEEKDGNGRVTKKANKKSLFNNIVSYILLVYDENSPMHKNFKSIEQKRENAINMSGVPSDILLHDEVIEMITEFLIYQNSKLWTLICVNENLFIEYLSVLNTKLDNFNSDKDIVDTLTKKEKVRGFMEKIADDLERLYKKLYLGDEELREESTKRRRLTPENVSSKLVS